MAQTDGRFLLVATEKVIKVYSVQNGHCVRSLGSAGEKYRIVGFVLDPVNEFRVIVGYGNERIRVYDWTDGLIISVLPLESLFFSSLPLLSFSSVPSHLFLSSHFVYSVVLRVRLICSNSRLRTPLR